jgi:hypothetical protein
MAFSSGRSDGDALGQRLKLGRRLKGYDGLPPA